MLEVQNLLQVIMVNIPKNSHDMFQSVVKLHALNFVIIADLTTHQSVYWNQHM